MPEVWQHFPIGRDASTSGGSVPDEPGRRRQEPEPEQRCRQAASLRDYRIPPFVFMTRVSAEQALWRRPWRRL
ncbi:hypothetical protein [Streptomyces sp. NBC_01233]|uniref:hypothetical protein n=1 Tax=Streptomyces sp. NBC_01233 TaxID=2903787 RepID=UPI002E165AA9|nr:hypothetical protein OG332_08080 [Streptomyces sp. NBC_01233]